MTNSQKLAVRLSEIRQRLNEIAGLEADALTTEIRSEADQLRTEHADAETQYRAALTGEGDEAETRAAAAGANDPAERALHRLIERGSALRIMQVGAVEHRALDGAEGELQQEFGLAPNQIPIEMLRGADSYGATEHRAVTAAPTNVAVVEDPVVRPVFASGAGAFLGIWRPTVDAGDAVYPVLKTRPTVGGPHTDSTDVAETNGTFSADLLAPGRIQASFLFRRVDAMRFPQMEPAFRAALNEGLQEKADAEVVSGTNGLLTGTNLPNHNQTAATTFANYISQFCYSRIDGRYASMQDELRVLMGAATYAHAGGVYRANESDVTALGRLQEATGGVRVSAHVPAVASTKQNNVICLGMRRDMVQPMWRNVTMLVDEVTKSGAGEIEVTAVGLIATKVIRAAGFYKQQTKVS